MSAKIRPRFPVIYRKINLFTKFVKLILIIIAIFSLFLAYSSILVSIDFNRAVAYLFCSWTRNRRIRHCIRIRWAFR